MHFAQAVQLEPFILFEGAVIERLRRDPAARLDPHILHAGLIYDPGGRQALEHIYRSYLDAGRDNASPMVILTPTWRANPERLELAGFGQSNTVNRDGYRFLNALRDTYGSYARSIWIGGLMGCRGDAYKPEEALSAARAHRFHIMQAHTLAEAGVDFLMGATLPAQSEALGMASAMAETGLPYVLSFVVRPGGTLLDGTCLHEAIGQIDARVKPCPLAYMVNCVHPSVFASALEVEHGVGVRARILGLQANTSAKPPEELDNSPCLESEAPDSFAEAMVRLRAVYGIKALGGCCGTDDRHIACIARRVAQQVAAVC
jgi:homocysteine S-methyltransferase